MYIYICIYIYIYTYALKLKNVISANLANCLNMGNHMDNYFYSIERIPDSHSQSVTSSY